MQRAEEEYISEKQSASRELEDKKIELQENLISELEEKKRHVETERITIELTGDSMEVSYRLVFSFLSNFSSFPFHSNRSKRQQQENYVVVLTILSTSTPPQALLTKEGRWLQLNWLIFLMRMMLWMI